jgi:hypothetical protein
VQEQAVKQCRTVDHWESRTSGYEVTYDYRGRNYTSIMSYDPGERVRLRVVVEPMQRYRALPCNAGLAPALLFSDNAESP